MTGASSRRKGHTEAALKRSVVKTLTLALGKRGKVLRMNAGHVVLDRGTKHERRISGSTPGTPDLLVVKPEGRVVWLELKAPKGKTTETQERFHSFLRSLGHTVAVVRSVGEAREAVGV